MRSTGSAVAVLGNGTNEVIATTLTTGNDLVVNAGTTIIDDTIGTIVGVGQGIFGDRDFVTDYTQNVVSEGLNEFRKDYPIAQCYLLYGGEHEERYDHILVLPMRKALFKLAEILRR